MYTKGTNESSQHVSVVEVQTKQEAEAYFAGRKQMTLEQFRAIFLVKEIKDSTKTLLYGNR